MCAPSIAISVGFFVEAINTVNSAEFITCQFLFEFFDEKAFVCFSYSAAELFQLIPIIFNHTIAGVLSLNFTIIDLKSKCFHVYHLLM